MAPRRLEVPLSQLSMAGSVVTSRTSPSNEPRPARRKSSYWLSIMRWLPTSLLDVANQSCQIRAMRCTKGWSLRTMRSSQKRWSCPKRSSGSSGPAVAPAFGSAPVKVSAPGGEITASTAPSSPIAARASGQPGDGPKPARQSNRSA